MAIFRNVNMSFWTDTKVVDDFTPEDKYFMLYCLTNQYTNIIGCYEISIKQISNDLGYTKDSVENLIKRFITLHKIVDYDFDTKELFVRNWHKYNWSTSPKLDIPLFNAIEKIKSDAFHDELAQLYNSRESVINKANEKEEKEEIYIPYRYPIDTTITNTIPIAITNTISNTISNTNSNTNNISKKEEKENEINDIVVEVVEYLNLKANTHYRTNSKGTLKELRARIKEGLTLEECKYIIDVKCNEWLGTEFEKNLNLTTLFRVSNYERYLNQKMYVKKDNSQQHNENQRAF